MSGLSEPRGTLTEHFSSLSSPAQNSSGRAVVQAGSTSTNDANICDDEEEHQRISVGSSHGPSAYGLQRRNSIASGAIGKRRGLLSPLENEAAAKGVELTPGTLGYFAMQARFRHAFAANHDPSRLIEPVPAQESESSSLPSSKAAAEPTSESTATLLENSNSAKLHRDILDAKNRKDRVAVSALVQAYRQLPTSQKTTAGFNAALQAQVSVRTPGESLREVRETHKDMLDAGCLPNSGTSAVMVKALCARDQEKKLDESAAEVSVEEEASSEAWRILSATPSGLQDIAAYNALLARCAAKGDSDRALSIFRMIEEGKNVKPDAETYVSVLTCLSKLSGEMLESNVLESRLENVKQTLRDAIASMLSPDWIHRREQDAAIFSTYVNTVFALQAPEEGLRLFERMILNEDGLPSPPAEVTEALVRGFATSGDVATALAWIDKIESLNKSSIDGSQILAAPDFADLKEQFGQAGAEATPEAPVETASTEAESAAASPNSVPVSQEQPETSPSLSSHGSSFDSTYSRSGSPASSISSGFPAPPGFPSLQVIDCDLGDRIKSMLRPSRKKDSKTSPGTDLERPYQVLMKEMHMGNYAPPEAFAQLLNAFGRAGKLARVHELRSCAHVAVSGLVGDAAWQSAAWADVEDNVVCALAHGGDVEGAHRVRHEMLAAGCAPSANSYAALISSIRDSTDEAMLAEQLYEESQRLNVRPNIYLVNTVISRLGRARRAERALQLYQSLPALGLKPTSITYGATLNCAVRVGDICTAEAIFRAMESDPNFVPRPPGYNSMIQFFTYTKPDRAKALEYWQKMQERGVRPSSHTYKLLLDVYATIAPVQPEAMNQLFARLLRDRSVEVAGPHWASLITCYGSHMGDLTRCQQIFRSISLKTGQAPDAVAYESLLQVYAQHGKLQLIDALLAEMIKCGVPRTAYVANHAIEGYARHGGPEGLMKARAIFSAMSQPPAGVASAGNHPLPRHHGAGSGNGPTYNDRRSSAAVGLTPARPYHHHHDLTIQEVLDRTSSHSTEPALCLSIDQQLSLLRLAFETVHPEPSTYEKMIQFEVANAFPLNAKAIVQRMEDRAFPPALVLKARSMLP